MISKRGFMSLFGGLAGIGIAGETAQANTAATAPLPKPQDSLPAGAITVVAIHNDSPYERKRVRDRGALADELFRKVTPLVDRLNAMAAYDLVYPQQPARHTVEWRNDPAYDKQGPVAATLDILASCELCNVEITHIELSQQAFRILRRLNTVNRVHDQEGRLVMYAYMGYRVRVPDTSIEARAFTDKIYFRGI